MELTAAVIGTASSNKHSDGVKKLIYGFASWPL
jgi:hypothetical protein